jgi:hypothetical protein
MSRRDIREKSACRDAGRRAFLLTALALIWSVGLLIAAVVVPFGSAPLVQENGARVLLVVAIPAVLSLVVWVALWRQYSRGGRLSRCAAWGCISVLCVFCLLGMLSIGILVEPVAVLLVAAALLTPSGSPPAQRRASDVGPPLTRKL